MYLFVLTGALLTWLNIHVEIGRHFFMDEGFMNSVIIIFVMYASSLSILTLESIPGEIGPQFFLEKLSLEPYCPCSQRMQQNALPFFEHQLELLLSSLKAI